MLSFLKDSKTWFW